MCLAALVAGAVAAAQQALGTPARVGANQAFAPESVTFVSSSQGWVLGVGSCSRGRCFGLLETTDGGSSWSQRPLPAGLATMRPASPFDEVPLDVRFADPLDGWIFGGVLQGGYSRPRIWATHDGGRSWQLQRLAWVGGDTSILDLEATAVTAYLLR